MNLKTIAILAMFALPARAATCSTSDDCADGALCTAGHCAPMQCAAGAKGKTGLRARIRVTHYVGVRGGRNGKHERLYGRIAQVLWAHDPSLVDLGADVQLDLNVSSSKDPAGLPHQIRLKDGDVLEVEGEYIDAAHANGTNGAAVLHFTHSQCGYVTIAGATYR